MMTGQELLAAVDAAFPGSTARAFAFPYTYIEITDQKLPDDYEAREQFVASQVGIDGAELRSICNRLFFRIETRRPSEASDLPRNRGEFWMRALQDGSTASIQPAPCKVVHYYGFKGGQGRSTVMAFLSKVLAEDGWRVLAVDMDAEAPSLDVLYGVTTTSMRGTVLGLRAEQTGEAARAYTATKANGYVDILPFRPTDQRYDLDAAALTMELSIHPPSQHRLIDSLRPLMSGYDAVLIDHRTGLAPTVLPWVTGLPGPVVVFARMDGQWRAALRHLAPLWREQREFPGFLVSAMPPVEDEDAWVQETQGQALEILSELSEALASVNEGDLQHDEELGPEDILDHWVRWPFDLAFGRTRVPDVSAVTKGVQDAASSIRRLLDMSGAIQREEEPTRLLHTSGGADDGHLIQTRALRDLSSANSPYLFVLGRKGTGKTRLLRALAETSVDGLPLGFPLLVPNEVPERLGGLVAEDAVLQLLAQSPPEAYWWTLLAAALEGNDTDRTGLRNRVQSLLRSGRNPIDAARSAVEKHRGRRVYLVDGLETAFPRDRTFAMLAALFRLVGALDADSLFRERVRIRVFIRTDLAQRGFENFEQQSHLRRLDLMWDTQSILNFALSRIELLPWFRSMFPEATDEVRRYLADLKAGAVSVEECDRLMMRYFPQRLGRMNINTTTFLRTWFSDDPKAESSFYPRVYDEFLRVIAGEGRDGYGGPEVEKGRLAPLLIYHAHAKATERFLSQVRSELNNIVELEPDEIADLLASMQGLVTPFVLDLRVGELAAKTSLTGQQIRAAMERMKRLGIFEDRPGFTGQWRVGRLFKSSLGMIYDRKRRRPDADLGGD